MTDGQPEYQEFASNEMDSMAMEAVVAEGEEGVDMDQAIKHQVYIGWVLAIMSMTDMPKVHWKGGNLISFEDVPGITLVIPYPPEDWKP
jgi:hypothetical protein